MTCREETRAKMQAAVEKGVLLPEMVAFVEQVWADADAYAKDPTLKVRENWDDYEEEADSIIKAAYDGDWRRQNIARKPVWTDWQIRWHGDAHGAYGWSHCINSAWSERQRAIYCEAYSKGYAHFSNKLCK